MKVVLADIEYDAMADVYVDHPESVEHRNQTAISGSKQPFDVKNTFD
jgi:hypothetical protein